MNVTNSTAAGGSEYSRARKSPRDIVRTADEAAANAAAYNSEAEKAGAKGRVEVFSVTLPADVVIPAGTYYAAALGPRYAQEAFADYIGVEFRKESGGGAKLAAAVRTAALGTARSALTAVGENGGAREAILAAAKKDLSESDYATLRKEFPELAPAADSVPAASEPGDGKGRKRGN